MATEVPQNVIDRILKLVALSNEGSGATEAEAANAANRATEMLQRYGLSIAEIEAAGGKTPEGGQREKQVVQRGAMYKWQKSLMESIAEANFCFYRIVEERGDDGRMKKRHQLIGRVVNVKATQILYDYLLQTMKRLVREAGHAPGTHNEKDYHWWLEGCATRLGERIETQAREAKEESARKEREKKAASSHPSAAPTTGTALVLADVYSNEEELNTDFECGLEPGTTTRRRLAWEEKTRQRQAAYDKLIAEGVDEDVAYYVAHMGYTMERAKETVEHSRKQLEAAASKPQRKSRARGRTYTWTKADQREHDKRNSASYRAGSSAGGSIGLDPQVTSDRKRRLGSS